MQLDLLEFLFTRLITDPELIDLFDGEVDVMYLQQLPEVAFPYIVHEWNVSVQAPWGIEQGVWTVHTWDQGSDGERSIKIHRRIKHLFDRLYYCDVENISGLRIWSEGESFEGEKEDRIWHNVNIFGIRYVDNEHIGIVHSRATGVS